MKTPSDVIREMRELYSKDPLGYTKANDWADALESSMREPFAWWLDPGDPYGLGCYAQQFKPDEDAFRRWPNLTVTKLYTLPSDVAMEIERLTRLVETTRFNTKQHSEALDEIERLREALAHYATDETAGGWVAIAALAKEDKP